MNDDAIDIQPLLDETQNFLGMFLREENVLGARKCRDVVEAESQHREEGVRYLSGVPAGIADRNADLLSARVVALRGFAREYNDFDALPGSHAPT